MRLSWKRGVKGAATSVQLENATANGCSARSRRGPSDERFSVPVRVVPVIVWGGIGPVVAPVIGTVIAPIIGPSVVAAVAVAAVAVAAVAVAAVAVAAVAVIAAAPGTGLGRTRSDQNHGSGYQEQYQ